MKHASEKVNWFKCPICQKVRLRGIEIRIEGGRGSGLRIIVCQTPRCQSEAKLGNLTVCGETNES